MAKKMKAAPCSFTGEPVKDQHLCLTVQHHCFHVLRPGVFNVGWAKPEEPADYLEVILLLA
jgi:hypothetical protein